MSYGWPKSVPIVNKSFCDLKCLSSGVGGERFLRCNAHPPTNQAAIYYSLCQKCTGCHAPIDGTDLCRVYRGQGAESIFDEGYT